MVQGGSKLHIDMCRPEYGTCSSKPAEFIQTYDIADLPGEDIGPEVMKQVDALRYV